VNSDIPGGNMNFFKRDKTTTDTPAPSGLSPVYTPSASLTGKTASTDDIQQARESVDFIAGELKASAEQQQLAAKRMSSLNKTISKMEAGLRHVNRLETETAQLRNDLQSTAKKLEQKTSWASEQENKLINLERQHNDIRQQLENAKADVAQRKDRESADREKLVKQGRDIETLSSQLTQKDERLAAVSMSNQNLQDEVAQQSASLSSQNHRVMELSKSIEELSNRLDKKSKASDTAEVELKNLRLDFNEMKTKCYAAIGGVTAGSSMIAAEAARADAAAKYPVLPKEENVSRRLKAIK